jgi:hypothetical protein
MVSSRGSRGLGKQMTYACNKGKRPVLQQIEFVGIWYLVSVRTCKEKVARKTETKRPSSTEVVSGRPQKGISSSGEGKSHSHTPACLRQDCFDSSIRAKRRPTSASVHGRVETGARRSHLAYGRVRAPSRSVAGERSRARVLHRHEGAVEAEASRTKRPRSSGLILDAGGREARGRGSHLGIVWSAAAGFFPLAARLIAGFSL